MNITFEIVPELKNLIPALSKEEYEQLEKDIIENGVLDPLKTWDGVLVDGHNRYEIAQRHGIDFKTIDLFFESYEDAKIWMINNQLGRRNISEEQKSYLRGKRYEAEKKKHGGDRESSAQNEHLQKRTSDLLAEEYNVSRETIKRDEKFAKGVDAVTPELKEEILKGSAGVNKGDLVEIGSTPQISSKLKEISKLTVQEQIKAVKEIAKEIRQQESKEKVEERRTLISKQIQDIESGKLPELEGLFDVIAIDPPWPYGREYDPNGSRVANPYPEMSIEQISDIQLPTTKDSVLFLWTTHQFLPSAFELLSKWGFSYKATMVWDKENIGMGAWLRMQCEFCLVGIKGRPFWENTKYRDIIREQRREHSRKPEQFYQIVNEITHGRRLEYFSREKRNGWEVFGNDIEKF